MQEESYEKARWKIYRQNRPNQEQIKSRMEKQRSDFHACFKSGGEKMKNPKKSNANLADRTESRSVHELITIIQKAYGRGGLTKITEKLGMSSPSSMRKRLSNPETAFDSVTMRAVLWIASQKSNNAPKDTPILSTLYEGNYCVQIRYVNGTPTPYWKPAE